MKTYIAAAFLLLPAVAAAQEYKIAVASPKGIFVMDNHGHYAQRAADDPAAILSETAWSPDGKRILFFVYRKADAAFEYKYNLPFHFPMYVMDADGTNQKRLLDVPAMPDARWSPDGHSILFTSSFEGDFRRRAVYILDLASGSRRRLTDFGFIGFATWSPDGKKVVFCSGTRPREVYVINADTTDLKPLTNLGMVAVGPVWAPDGHAIAFIADGWFVMDPDGSNKKRVSQLGASSLTWSPDSRHIAVTGQGGGYVWHASDNTSTPLPMQGGRILEAVFSPDSRKVLYRAHGGTQDRIFIVNVDGSDLQTLSDDMGDRALFAVSPAIR